MKNLSSVLLWLGAALTLLPIVVICAVLFVLLCIGVAKADAAPFGPAEDAAYAEAAAYWGAEPSLCASLTKEVVPAGVIFDPETGQEAAGSATVPEGRPTPCVIRVVAGRSPLALCALMRHEYGHLLGLGHDDPRMGVLACGEDPEVKRQRLRDWADWRGLRSRCRRQPPGSKKRWCWREARTVARWIRASY